jgi:hypothetical protein
LTSLRLRDRLGMNRLYRIIVVGSVLLATGSCSSSERQLPLPRPTGPTCMFKIGDILTRGGNAAVEVPDLGKGVIGAGDAADGSSATLDVSTSLDGVVTIRFSKNGVPAPVETCVLR